MHIRVSEVELRRDDQESVGLTEGGGYLAWLGVFHGLHCVVRVPPFFFFLSLSLSNSYSPISSLSEKGKETKTEQPADSNPVFDRGVKKNMLRKYIYKDHYHPNLTPKETLHLSSHVGS